MSNRGGKVMCKAVEVGKIVVNKCLDLKIQIDVQKLQKLLVLMQIECLKQSKKPLFREDIVIWNCGVAIKEVDEAFRDIGKPFQERQTEYINLLNAEERSVDFIIKLYGMKNAIELSALPILQNVCSLSSQNNGFSVPHISFTALKEVIASNEC